jgi:hypothetical protein
MAYAQLVCHYLIGVLAVGLAQIFVQHYAVNNGQTKGDCGNLEVLLLFVCASQGKQVA